MLSKANAALVIATVATLFSISAFSAVSAEEAKKLGGPVLTEFGAERAGNKEGTIPAYDAATAQPKAPPSWNPQKPFQRQDPWGEKPLFTITAQNADQYADKLDGIMQLFKIYPNYKMNIYPSHRTASYPKYVLDNSVKNGTSCKSLEGDLVLEGCYGGVPFPIPTNGSQIMWNHLLTFEAEYQNASTRSWIVSPNGNSTLVGHNLGKAWLQYYDPKKPGPRPSNLIYWLYRSVDIAPARTVGQQLILLDPLDAIKVGRRAYQYIPGQRRVKLAPDLAYDTPSPYSGGSQNMDDAKGFLGAIDHFDWKLIGKKEKFIPYNNLFWTDNKRCPESVVNTPRFPNPECMRWELHRVWVVQGTVKAGVRHAYAKRIHYFDEDTYGAGTAEMYDASGALYRLNFVHHWPWYKEEAEGQNDGENYVMDLRTGIYSLSGIGNCDECGYSPYKYWDPINFTPEIMAGEGIR
jgi:hypothetical protein